MTLPVETGSRFNALTEAPSFGDAQRMTAEKILEARQALADQEYSMAVSTMMGNASKDVDGLLSVLEKDLMFKQATSETSDTAQLLSHAQSRTITPDLADYARSFIFQIRRKLTTEQFSQRFTLPSISQSLFGFELEHSELFRKLLSEKFGKVDKTLWWPHLVEGMELAYPALLEGLPDTSGYMQPFDATRETDSHALQQFFQTPDRISIYPASDILEIHDVLEDTFGHFDRYHNSTNGRTCKF